jgi:hypothetical protein
MWGNGNAVDMTGDRLLDGGLRMAWVLRLVETEIGGPARIIDVMDIRPLGDLGDIAKLCDRAREGGLTLSEAKQNLARLQAPAVSLRRLWS